MKKLSFSSRGLMLLAFILLCLPLALPNSFYYDVAIRIAKIGRASCRERV